MYINLIVVFLTTCLSEWTIAQPEPVLLEEVYTGHYTRTVENALPETMTFTLNRRGSQGYHTLHLVENKRLNENAPMFEVVVENGRQKLVKKETMPLKTVKFYHDKENGGSFQAECLTRSYGACTRILSGSLELDNEMYEIMPSPELHTERSFTSSTISPHVIVRIERSAPSKPVIPDVAKRQPGRASSDSEGDVANKLRSLLRNKGHRGYPTLNLKPSSENVESSLKSVLKKHFQQTNQHEQAEASEKGAGLLHQLKASLKRIFLSDDEKTIETKNTVDDTRDPPGDTVGKKNVDDTRTPPEGTVEKKINVDDTRVLLNEDDSLDKKSYPDDTREIPKGDAIDYERLKLIRELEELIALEESEGRKTNKKRQTTATYALEILIAIDPSVWESYLAITSATDDMTQVRATEYRLRQYFSHIVNGISLRYEAMKDTDPDMDIYVTLSGFLLYKVKNDSNPLNSSVEIVVIDGTEYVDGDVYLNGLKSWAEGLTGLPDNDHIMVFTAYDIYASGNLAYNSTSGLAWVGAVCTSYRVSIQEISSYYLATSVAAHELGHNLGSYHDGYNENEISKACNEADEYLMAPILASFSKTEAYKINPWRFSTCSINAFKAYVTSLGTTAPNNCLLDTGDHFNITEYNEHVAMLPGERYSLEEQCKLFLGTNSSLYNNTDVTSERVCINMECIDPSDGKCNIYTAARGSPCGISSDNKWCIDGSCVSKSSSSGDSDTTAASTTATTAAPTTATPTTAAPTTATTAAPTTAAPTTATTAAPTTATTAAPTTAAPTTAAPTTAAPTTATTAAPTTTSVTTAAPTTASTTTTDVTDGSCTDSLWEGWTCEEINKYLYDYHGVDTESWCPTFTVSCCAYCSANVASPVTESCTNGGWYDSNGSFWSCRKISNYFYDCQDGPYEPASWCRDPAWKRNCCRMCVANGV